MVNKVTIINPFFSKVLFFTELLIYGSYFKLKSEIKSLRLGIAWWILDPILVMIVYYIAFGVILQFRSDEFISFLLVGIITWQWISSTIRRSASSILDGKRVSNIYHYSRLYFPLVSSVAEFVKNLFVIILLLFALYLSGNEITEIWLYYPVIVFTTFLLITASSIFVSLVIPVFPDLTKILNRILTGLLFCSGIFYPYEMIPEHIQPYFLMNPFAFLIYSSRQVLLENEYPDAVNIVGVNVSSILLIIICLLIYKNKKAFYLKKSS